MAVSLTPQNPKNIEHCDNSENEPDQDPKDPKTKILKTLNTVTILKMKQIVCQTVTDKQKIHRERIHVIIQMNPITVIYTKRKDNILI